MPPSTIVLLDNIVAVLWRSPAIVEHQDRHHAVVLTELLPEALLDRSSGCVIELYVCQELGGAGVTVLGSVEPGRRTTTSSTLRQRFRFGLRGYVDNTLPSRCYASPRWILRVRRNFFEITVFSNSGIQARSMRRCYMHE